jgi:cell division control protein 45
MLLLINVGGHIDLPSANWFGEFEEHVTVHVVDSIRPLSSQVYSWMDQMVTEWLREMTESWYVFRYVK